MLAIRRTQRGFEFSLLLVLEGVLVEHLDEEGALSGLKGGGKKAECADESIANFELGGVGSTECEECICFNNGK